MVGTYRIEIAFIAAANMEHRKSMDCYKDTSPERLREHSTTYSTGGLAGVCVGADEELGDKESVGASVGDAETVGVLVGI